MDHPLRTLLYELFVAPPLQLLQKAFGRNRRAATLLTRAAPLARGSRKPANSFFRSNS